MTTSTIKLYTLSLNTLSNWAIAAMFIAANIVVPQAIHLIEGGGQMLIPIYFFTLIAAYKYGWKAGLLTAVASPIINSLIGMPSFEVLPIILVKSIILALTASIIAQRTGKATLWGILSAVVIYQVLGSLIEWAIVGDLHTAVQDFRLAIPGILIQIFGCWAILNLILRR